MSDAGNVRLTAAGYEMLPSLGLRVPRRRFGHHNRSKAAAAITGATVSGRKTGASG
jgi:hypothetical protein